MALLVLALAVAVPAALGALLTEQPVLTTRANEQMPAGAWDGGDELIGYAKSRPRRPGRYDAWLERRSGSTVVKTRLNRVGQGFFGGLDDANDELVYQGVYRGQSSIWGYRPNAGGRFKPRGVNSARWEWRPTVSGNYVLFNRDALSRPLQQVLLKDISNFSAPVRLTYTNRARDSTFAGQVNGDWAVFTRCVPRCNVFVRRISLAKTTRLAKPYATGYQYAPSVTSTGIVYVARSHRSCGSGVRLFRYTPAQISSHATGTRVATLSTGYDTFSSFARENAGGTVDVFYDRVRCSANRWNVYKITDTP